MGKRFIDAIRRYQRNQQASLDEPISFAGESVTTLLDTIPQPQILPDDREILQEILQADPENLFKKEHIKNHPEANFQAITLRRLAQQSWNNMSTEWKIGVSTVSSFYQRCLKYFIPKIQEYYQDIRLRLYPAGDAIYLPQGLELIVLDNDSNFIDFNKARNADNWMQLELEEGRPGDTFKVKVALGDFHITENFIL